MHVPSPLGSCRVYEEAADSTHMVYWRVLAALQITSGKWQHLHH